MIIRLSEKYRSGELAGMCGGKVCGDVLLDSISIDSREIYGNTLFVALKGENTDGHKYIDGAVKNGAVCVMCERVPEGFSGNYIMVGDSIRAISDIASFCREKFGPLTVGVTGSVGKTTTKEFISYVLSEKYETLKSEGNFNTVYGISLTLASLGKKHGALVTEMGMSSLGEISLLTSIAKPDVAVITNIGTAHLESLGSRENICRAKLEIIEGLKDGGVFIYNGDEPLLTEKSGSFPKNSYSFGIKNRKCDYFGENIRFLRDGTVFDILHGGKTVRDVRIPAVGEHNVYDALAAYAVGSSACLTEKEIRNGLMKYVPAGMRQKIYDKNGYTVIEDCYNASPESVKASLSVLSSLGDNSRKVAVLGEMRELGEKSDELHKSVGEYAASLGIDRLYTYGDAALEIAVGALENGMNEHHIIAFKNAEDPEGMAAMLKDDLRRGDVVLFKASRAVRLERVIEILG